MKIISMRSYMAVFAITIVVGCGLGFQAEATQKAGRIVSPHDGEWVGRYRGRIALVKELRKALDSGAITREEFSDGIFLVSNSNDGVAASAAKTFELTQDYNDVLTQLVLDREVAEADPQAKPEQRGKLVSPANSEWRIKYRGRIALVTQIRMAFDRGLITQEEMLGTSFFVLAVDDVVAAGAAKAFRRNGDFKELKQTLESNQRVRAHEDGVEQVRDCSAEAHSFFLGCMYAGGQANDCGQQSHRYWCGCMGGLILDGDFCLIM